MDFFTQYTREPDDRCEQPIEREVEPRELDGPSILFAGYPVNYATMKEDGGRRDPKDT